MTPYCSSPSQRTHAHADDSLQRTSEIIISSRENVPAKHPQDFPGLDKQKTPRSWNTEMTRGSLVIVESRNLPMDCNPIQGRKAIRTEGDNSPICSWKARRWLWIVIRKAIQMVIAAPFVGTTVIVISYKNLTHCRRSSRRFIQVVDMSTSKHPEVRTYAHAHDSFHRASEVIT